MLVRIDSRSETPIYRQIAKSIGDQITDGSIAPGERLPPARALASTLKINMHTVLQAYSHLESEGRVEVRRGRGGVVAKGEGDLGAAVDKMVASAKRHKLGLNEVVTMIEERWR